MQERMNSDRTESFIEHRPVGRYIINTHAIHNAHLVRAAIPRHLTRPVPLFLDRKQEHERIASNYRKKQGAKREANKLKSEARKRKREEEKDGELDTTTQQKKSRK